MKMLSATVAGLGVLALVLGIAGRLIGISAMMGITPGGFVRGATALYLLALVVMIYGRCYCDGGAKAPGAKE